MQFRRQRFWSPQKSALRKSQRLIKTKCQEAVKSLLVVGCIRQVLGPGALG